ncbi:MAG: HEAT repeat domain-containing protein, partial [Deltaproteobacteria bacterium]
MSAFDSGSGSGGIDPRRVAIDALADLAAVARGGGRPGVSADQLARDFARNMALLLQDSALVVDVRDDGLFADGAPLWAHDLLARRVAIALRDQGLRAMQLEQGASPEALRGLALVLARDWKTQGEGALQSLVEGHELPGIQFDFGGGDGDDVQSLDPRTILEVIRAGGADAHPQVSRIVGRFRDAMAKPLDVDAAILGAGMADRERIRRELTGIEEDADTKADDIGRVVFECMRLDPSALQASDTFRFLADHVDHLIAAGRPGEALGLLRRPLALLHGELVADWPHRDVVGAELVLLFDPQALARLQGAANHGGDPTEWRRLLFTLGRVAPESHRAAFCSACGRLDAAELRLAAADGIVVGADRPAEVLGLLLAEVEDEGLAVVLLGLSRLDTPALLEKILMRLDSPHAVVREAALVALRKHRTPHTRELVRRAIEDEVEAVRVEALRYVSVYRDVEAAPVILARLRGDAAGTLSARELRALAMA